MDAATGQHAREPVTEQELHLAFARVPNTAGFGGFDKALRNPATRRCLTIMVYQMRRKKVSELFQILTTECLPGEPVDCRYVLPGHVREIAPRVVLHLHADRIDEPHSQRYEPNVTVFANGKPVPGSDDGYSFNLSRQAGLLMCIRGMQVDRDGKPTRFLVELYKRRVSRHLHVVA